MPISNDLGQPLARAPNYGGRRERAATPAESPQKPVMSVPHVRAEKAVRPTLKWTDPSVDKTVRS